MILAGSSGMDPVVIEWALLVTDTFVRCQRQAVHFGNLEILVDFCAQVEWVSVIVQIWVVSQAKIEPALHPPSNISKSTIPIFDHRFHSPVWTTHHRNPPPHIILPISSISPRLNHSFRSLWQTQPQDLPLYLLISKTSPLNALHELRIDVRMFPGVMLFRNDFALIEIDQQFEEGEFLVFS
jgi:hypothetical protein